MIDSRSRRLTRAVLFAVLAIASGTAGAQIQWVSYAAKFVCGDRPADNFGAVTGRYVTTINIHNRHYDPDIGIFFCKKVAYGRPQRAPLFEPSPRVPELLPPDYTLAVDCEDIKALQTPPFVFYEGYLVIEVPTLAPGNVPQDARGLDVTAVYSAKPRPGEEGTAPEVKSLHVEQFFPQDVRGQPFPQDACLAQLQ